MIDKRQVGLVVRYTAAMLVLGFAAGVLLGTIRALIDVEHVWGAIDGTMLARLIGTGLVAAWVYSRLARMHPNKFLSNGIAVATATGLVNLLIGVIRIPDGVNPPYGIMAFMTLGLHLLLFVLVAGLLRINGRLLREQRA